MGPWLGWRAVKRLQSLPIVDKQAFLELCRLLFDCSIFKMNLDTQGQIWKDLKRFCDKLIMK